MDPPTSRIPAVLLLINSFISAALGVSVWVFSQMGEQLVNAQGHVETNLTGMIVMIIALACLAASIVTAILWLLHKPVAKKPLIILSITNYAWIIFCFLFSLPAFSFYACLFFLIYLVINLLALGSI